MEAIEIANIVELIAEEVKSPGFTDEIFVMFGFARGEEPLSRAEEDGFEFGFGEEIGTVGLEAVDGDGGGHGDGGGGGWAHGFIFP